MPLEMNNAREIDVQFTPLARDPGDFDQGRTLENTLTRIFSHIKLDSRPLTPTNRGIQMRAAFLNFTPKDTSFIALGCQVVDEKTPFLLALSAIGHNHWVTESIYYTPTRVALPDARAWLSQYNDSQKSPFCWHTIILTNALKDWLFFFAKHRNFSVQKESTTKMLNMTFLVFLLNAAKGSLYDLDGLQPYPL